MDLYEIMDQLAKKEYDLQSLIYILNRLDMTYDDVEHTDMKLLANIIQEYLIHITSGIRKSIDELDRYIMNES